MSATEKRMSQLFQFLDQVEDETEKELSNSRCGSICGFSVHSVAQSVISRRDDQKETHFEINEVPLERHEGSVTSDVKSDFSSSAAHGVFGDIKRKMMNYKVQIEDQTRTIEVLKKALERTKKQKNEIETGNRKELKRKITRLRKEHDVATARHLKFVDKLLEDKDKLSQQCANLGKRLEELEILGKKKLNYLKEEHERILKIEYEKWQVLEKKKRNNWIAKKTREIKESTIKSLEPEIQVLIEQNKKELQAKYEQHAREISEIKCALRSDHEEEVCHLKQALIKQRESILETQRNVFEEKLTKKCEEYAEKLSASEKRLRNEFELERVKLTDKQRNERSKWQDNLEIIKKRHKDYITSLESGFAVERKRLLEKHEHSLSRHREKMSLEKEHFKEECSRKFNQQMQQRENELHDRVSERQRQELEIVIGNLVKDSQQKTEKLEKQHSNILENVKRRHEEKTKKLIQENQALELLLKDLRKQIRDLEFEIKEKIKIVRLSEDENKSVRAKLKETQSEMDTLQVNLSKTKAKQTEQIGEETKHLRIKINTLEDSLAQVSYEKGKLQENHNLQAERHEERKNMELDQVEMRVRQTLCRKDDIIMQLKQQIEAKNLRIQQTEILLNQQKDEILTSL